MPTVKKGIKKGGARRFATKRVLKQPPYAMRAPDNNVYDVTTSSVSMDTTSATAGLFFPTRTGNTYQDRNGDKCTITSIRFRYSIKAGSSQNGVQYCRVMLYWDNQPNGAVPGSNLPLTALTVLALTDPQFTKRFTILHDKVHAVTVPSVSVPDDNAYFGQYILPKCSLLSQFNGNAGTIADITSGSLNLLVLGDTANGANANPVINYVCRSIFKP